MSFREILKSTWWAAIAVALGGCASRTAQMPPEISPNEVVRRFESRTLRDPGLRDFLRVNSVSVDDDTLDFDALCWVAFYFNPSVEVARQQWRVVQAAEASARARPNPTLTLSPGYNFTRVPGLSPWMPAVNLDFLFPTAGKRGLQQSIAQHEADALRHAFVSSVWQLRSELRRALIELSAAQQREAATQSQLEIQRRVKVLIEQRFALGGISATDVATARATLLRAESSSLDARVQINVARAHVASALGMPVASIAEVTMPRAPSGLNFSKADLAAARATSLRSRADVLEALAKYESARASLRLELAKRIPDFHLGPGYQWDQGANKWTLGISFEIPVFHHNEAPIAEAAARVAEAAARFDLVQFQAIAAIDAGIAAQTAAADQLQRARALQDEIEKQNRSVKQRRDLGGADEVEVESSELDFETTTSTASEAEYALAIASGQLEDALQLPFPHFLALVQPPANR